MHKSTNVLNICVLRMFVKSNMSKTVIMLVMFNLSLDKAQTHIKYSNRIKKSISCCESICLVLLTRPVPPVKIRNVRPSAPKCLKKLRVWPESRNLLTNRQPGYLAGSCGSWTMPSVKREWWWRCSRTRQLRLPFQPALRHTLQALLALPALYRIHTLHPLRSIVRN